jgi:predicted porin
LGVSSPYGTLTVFRQNSLTLDAVFAYDPMGASYAFSPIGFQGITCGVGDTEDCRFSTSVKYRVEVGQLRVAALWQFGGNSLNNAATGSYQFQVGGDITNLAGGTLSLDAIGSYVQNAVSIALAGSTLPAVLPQVVTATLSDDSSVMLVGKYSMGPVKLFAGYEFIRYAPPSNSFATGTGFNDISGDFVCAGRTAFNNTNISSTAFNAGDKLFHVFWTGVKYAITDNLDLIGAYYHYTQPTFGAFVNCTNPAAFANCHGTMDAVSVVADWQFAKKFDAYAGIMFLAGQRRPGEWLHQSQHDRSHGCPRSTRMMSSAAVMHPCHRVLARPRRRKSAATSASGAFETCRMHRAMSAFRGNPEDICSG